MTDGRIIEGESQIPHAHGRIKSVFTTPEHPKAIRSAVDAIKRCRCHRSGAGEPLYEHHAQSVRPGYHRSDPRQ